MKMSDGVEWSIHCAWMLALAPDGRAVPGRRLAEYHGLPEAYLSKVLQSLVRAELLQATTGPRGGLRLAREPERITVLDLVNAVEGPAPAFRCSEIRQRGPCAGPPRSYRRPCGIACVMRDAERVYRERLQATTLADLLDEAGAPARRRAHDWLVSVLPPTSAKGALDGTPV
jgi:Rrf2 family protein